MTALVKQELTIGDVNVIVDTGNEEYFLLIMDRAGFCFSKEESKRIYNALKIAFEHE